MSYTFSCLSTENTQRLCTAFLEVVDSIVGVQLAGTTGFQLAGDLLSRHQEEAVIRSTEGLTVEFLDSRDIIHGIGPPTDSNSEILHTVSQGEYKARNAPGGSNPVFLTNLCAVSIYQFWEDHFRGEIAGSLGKKKNELCVSVMGDLRYTRQSIIHNGGVAISEVERSQVLRWYKRGEQINLNKDRQFDTMAYEIKRAIAEIAQGD